MKLWKKLALGVATAALVLSLSTSLSMSNGATTYDGTVTIAVTGDDVQFSATVGVVKCICIIADRDNQQPLFIGVSGVDGDGYKLWPGAKVTILFVTVTELYLDGTIGDMVYWIASNATLTVAGL